MPMEKIALIGFENAYPIRTHPENEEILFELGCLYMSLFYNTHSPL
jgi:microsomal dipeptidase-like Zn-dependent dipeptidase